MSSVANIVRALTEGDDDFDFEGDQKDLQPSEWSLRFGRDSENNLWFAQLLWGGSPYGVVAQHVDKDTCVREAAKMLARFQKEERAYLQIGKRVMNYETGEMGVITGIPGPDERWVHWDNDGGDPDSASRHSTYELELMEGLEDEDDLKDAIMPNGFEAKIKHSPRDNTWSVLFYYDGKFQGSSSGAETEQIAKWRAVNWVKEFNRCQTQRPFIPASNVDVWSWYYGFGPHTHKQPHEGPVEEGLEDEEDFKLEVHNAYAKGTKVRVLKGTYEGEIGTVEGAFHWGNGEIGWWVHLDGSDDPNSAITYHVDSIELLRESVEDDDLIEPKFTITPINTASAVYDIFANEQWIGRITRQEVRRLNGRVETRYAPMWMPKKHEHPRPESFATAHEAALWFWHHHYFAADIGEGVVRAIVNEATEDDEDSDWIKGMVHDPALLSKSALESAGFQVEVCEREGDSIVLVIHWPIPIVSAKINGWKRVVEILDPIIGKIKLGDYRFDNYYRGQHGEEKMAKVILRKRLEDDPTLWRVEKKTQRQLDQNAFWTIKFNGQDNGEFYATPEGAERLRRELVELHRIVPFYPVGWGDVEGNAWGTGKIIAWWRAHRSRLPQELRVAEHFVDKNLVDPNDWRRP